MEKSEKVFCSIIYSMRDGLSPRYPRYGYEPDGLMLIRQNKGMSLAAIGNNGAQGSDVKEIKAIVKPTVQAEAPRPVAQPVAPVVAAPTPVAAPTTSPDMSALQAQLEALKAENAQLKMSVDLAQKLTKGGLSLKVAEKGGLSLYGLGRFPTTLYVEQWEKLLTYSDSIREFITTNRAALKSKEQK